MPVGLKMLKRISIVSFFQNSAPADKNWHTRKSPYLSTTSPGKESLSALITR